MSLDRRKSPRARAELTFDADHLPVSPCQKCRRNGLITACERKRLGETWEFVCHHCRRRWAIDL